MNEASHPYGSPRLAQGRVSDSRNERTHTREQSRARKEAVVGQHRNDSERTHVSSPHTAAAASDNHGPAALAYLLTFHTYGTWLHGTDRGSVDRNHNAHGAPFVATNAAREHGENQRLKAPALILNAARRAVVQRTIVEVCEHSQWTIHALNVRSNHVHVVLSADRPPERILNTLKSWATRRMVEAGMLPQAQRAWSRHGSTRYLWKWPDVRQACAYVTDDQGPDLPLDDA